MGLSTSNSDVVRQFLASVLPRLACLLAVVAVGAAFARMALPLTWHKVEPSYVTEKIDESLLLDRKIDCVIVGSSKLYRHVSPEILDQQSRSVECSYNLAVPAMFPFRSFDMLEAALEAHPAVKTVILELAEPEQLGGNMPLLERIHGVTPERAAVLWGMTGKLRNYRTREYVVALAAKSVGAGLRDHVVAYFLHNPWVYESRREDWKDQRGFLPLDVEFAQSPNAALENRRRRFQDNAETMARSIAARCRIKEPNPRDVSDDAYAGYWGEQIESLRSRGVRTVVVIPPLSMHYDYLYRIGQSLQADCVLVDLCDSQANPEFYDPRYMFDEGHLNSAGAKLITERIAQAIDQR